jgi:hypothetical protein
VADEEGSSGRRLRRAGERGGRCGAAEAVVGPMAWLPFVSCELAVAVRDVRRPGFLSILTFLINK